MFKLLMESIIKGLELKDFLCFIMGMSIKVVLIRMESFMIVMRDIFSRIRKGRLMFIRESLKMGKWDTGVLDMLWE